ncbi:toxin-antitoxin system HicB family antitoxin [Auraticoccus cholistanensis]|nr:toxin-antitoxin system HicB family antitoxin [Auraticoccus cholistanensis]
MNIDSYLESVRTGVRDAAALADDRTRQVADQLSTALESTVRLTLVQALSDAATELSYHLAPSSVALRLDGGEPRFEVTVVDPEEEPTVLAAEEEVEEETEQPGDEPMARISLRLPQSLKERADQLADEQGVSTNVWITQAIMRASRPRGGRGGWGDPGRGGRRGEGEGRPEGGRGRRRHWDGPMADDGSGFGPPVPPVPPDLPFPPGFPFGPRHGHGPRGRGGRRGPESGGNVQGWVR